MVRFSETICAYFPLGRLIAAASAFLTPPSRSFSLFRKRQHTYSRVLLLYTELNVIKLQREKIAMNFNQRLLLAQLSGGVGLPALSRPHTVTWGRDDRAEPEHR